MPFKKLFINRHKTSFNNQQFDANHKVSNSLVKQIGQKVASQFLFSEQNHDTYIISKS